MNILVGCKVVPEEQDIVVDGSGLLDFSKASPKISPFDLNAIQAAVDIKQSVDGVNIKAISISGKYLENTKIKKDILSRGVDELNIVMNDDYENLLPHDTAEIFKFAAQNIGFDLIICADSSADLFAAQVGMRVGALLGIPTINCVNKILSIDSQSATITVQRELEDEIEELELSLPALICVSTDINVPTIPGMKAVLAASKKPINILQANYELNDMVKLEEVKSPKKRDRLKIISQSDNEESMAEFISNFKKALK
ncbi:MAG: putative electron transfer flavoprotein FixA [Campylobacter sp.]|nr:putative electron transfer flavoprotein FixA [Campylobacter sp.]